MGSHIHFAAAKQMMKSLSSFLVSILVVHLGWAATLDREVDQFLQFEAKFSKVYASEAERTQRFDIFRENLKEISQHNQRPNVSYRKGINQFADLTAEEFRTVHLGGYVKTGSAGQGSSFSSLPVLKSSMSLDDFKGL